MRNEMALGLLVVAFLVHTQTCIVAAITFPGDVQALMQVKAAMDPATIHTASCLSSWDFSLDPCDNRFRQLFTCGFDCEASMGGVQRVTSLKLDSSGYKGSLSPSIGKLTALRYLRISGNSLGGVIPHTIGQLSQLIMLDLSCNNLTGRIPESVGLLRSLQTFNIANNLLEGPIPCPLNNLVGLTELRMDGNNLDGSLPDLSNLKQLQFLDVSNNQLSGGIPQGLPPFVYSLSLKNNRLVGSVPQIIHWLQQLNVLDVSGNQLTGPVDATLLAHPSLQQLNLSNNRFTTLNVTPTAVAKSQIIALDLSFNQICGPLPGYFTSMSKLSSLSLRYNFFYGVIPQGYALKAASALVGVEPLERLMLDGNYLTGPLPAPFMNLVPESSSASFVDNCLYSCPARFFFCQGGDQKSESLCRLFNRSP